MDCPLCGEELKEVGSELICPNCGFSMIKEERAKEKKKKDSYPHPYEGIG